jgi:hypothetical protein
MADFEPKTWIEEANPLGPPADPFNNTPIDGAALNELEQRIAGAVETDWTSFVLAPRVMHTAMGVSAAAYDEVSDRTFYVYRGPLGDYYVGYFDHTLGEPAEGVRIGSFEELDPDVSPSDGHGVASLAIDGDGYLHVVALPHDSTMGWYKSEFPRDIAGTWTLTLGGGPDATLWPGGTYTSICYEPVTDALWCLYRSGTYGTHGTDAYPSHSRAALIKLPNGAAAFTDVRPGVDGGIIDTLGYPGVTTTDVYIPQISAYTGGRLLMTWTIAIGSVHDGVRVNVYAAIYDPVTDKVYSVGGTDLGSQIQFDDAAERAACEVYHADDGTGLPGDPDTVGNPYHYVEPNGDIVIVFSRRISESPAESMIRVSKWANNTWTHVDTGIRHYGSPIGSNYAIHKREDGVYEMLAAIFQYAGGYVTAGKDLILYTSPDGLTWTKERTLVKATEVSGLWVEAIVAPRPSHRGLKALWNVFGSGYYTADVELLGISDQDVNPSKLAGSLWRKYKNAYFGRDAAWVITDNAPPAGGSGTYKEVDFSAGRDHGKLTAVWAEVKFAGTATNLYMYLRPSFAYDPIPPATRREVGLSLPVQAYSLETVRIPVNNEGKFQYSWGAQAGAVTSVTFSILGYELH